MDRRQFLQLGTGSILAAAGGAGTAAAGGVGPETATQAAGHARPQSPRAEIIVATADAHRRRLQNIAECERSIRKCLRRHVVGEYLPGQCVYNLGEYPWRRPWNPDEWDERELDALRAAGVELVQLHEDWNDAQRLYGGDKFTPANPEGFRRFVRMVHARNMRVIVYASSGFFERRDPDFRREWAQGRSDLVEFCYQYACCSPASAGWRAYLLPKLRRILDEFEVDGLYDDLGYIPLHDKKAAGDEVRAFEESATHDGALEDLLGIIYDQVKRRGGVFKVHYSAAGKPATQSKAWDYLWVGESVRDGDGLRQTVKNYEPYVVPCLDMSRARIEREDDLYLQAIPYLQFPLLVGGRPFTGERGQIPGIQYASEGTDFWTQHCRRIWRHHQEHPEGPHSYGWWDSCPGRPEARPTHAKWLKLYRPMVEAGTVAYLEVSESDLFKTTLPKDVVASVFANRELYLVIANYGATETKVETAGTFARCGFSEASGDSWTVPGRSMLILKRA